MALYKPSFMSPNNIAVDALLDNDFTLQIEGNICVGYAIRIYRNSDNVLIYNPSIVDITLTPLYNGDILTVVVPLSSGMLNDTDYKWEIDLYETSPFNTPITSNEIFFKARTTPTVSIDNFVDPVVVRNYIFTGLYSQEESVSIKYYQFLLYSATSGNLIEDTGKVFSANIEFDYGSYLNGQDYEINLIVENQDSTIIETGNQAFSATYAVPTVVFDITATSNADKTAIEVDWSGLVLIPGREEGVAPSYLSDTPFIGTDSLSIPDETLVIYDEKNGSDLDFNVVNTLFIHTNFKMVELANNIYSGSGWSISGVISIQESQGDSGTVRKILTFENNKDFNLYLQVTDGSEPTLEETYEVSNGGNAWLLTNDGIPVDASEYVWDDTKTWNDAFFWTETDFVDDGTWWQLAWISDAIFTQSLVWKRNTNV